MTRKVGTDPGSDAEQDGISASWKVHADIGLPPRWEVPTNAQGGDGTAVAPGVSTTIRVNCLDQL